ncbi:MAG: hypothetical protein ACOYWZ_07140 [Bacillota bacterium]
MKRLVLLVLLFCLLGTVGCMNKNESNKSEVDKPTSVTTKIITEDKPTSGPLKDVTEDKSKENSYANKEDGIQSEVINKTNHDLQGLSAFIPKGWHILQKSDDELAIAEGDLNKDEITDVALVIEDDKDVDARSLLIAFGNPDKTFSLSIMADNAIMRTWEGGGFGDPFQEIKVDRGSILLKFFGGSSERWHQYYRFRYQNNGWYLIGYTEGSYVSIGDTMEVVEEDYNLLTGDYIIEKVEDGKIKTIKGNRGKKQLMSLQDFVGGTDESQF